MNALQSNKDGAATKGKEFQPDCSELEVEFHQSFTSRSEWQAQLLFAVKSGKFTHNNDVLSEMANKEKKGSQLIKRSRNNDIKRLVTYITFYFCSTCLLVWIDEIDAMWYVLCGIVCISQRLFFSHLLLDCSGAAHFQSNKALKTHGMPAECQRPRPYIIFIS